MSMYHYEVLGHYLREIDPQVVALLSAEDSEEQIAKMVDGQWSYSAPSQRWEETRQYKTAKGAKKRMEDWRESDYRHQNGWIDYFTGIRFHCDMNPPDAWRPNGWRSDSWTHKRTYAGIVIEVSDRIPSDIWKTDKFPIVAILKMAAEDLRKANPVSQKHLHVVEMAPADKDGIVIVELGWEKDYVVAWPATIADAIHMARCLSQLYRECTIAVYGRFTDGWEWRPLEWKGDSYFDWDRSLHRNKPLGDLNHYGAKAVQQVEELAELTAKLGEIPPAETNLAEYNTIHDFIHARLGKQLMQALVNIGAVTPLLVAPNDSEPSLN